MKNSALLFFAVSLFLAGCAEPPASESSPTDATSNNRKPTASAEDIESINAATLLASTLETAKADNKRVMVHLGAPG